MSTRHDRREYEKKQEQGQSFYRQKNYKAALESFNEILLRDEEPSLSLLDNRAATLTKLGNLQGALRDGKRMMNSFKTEVSGYLRAGQILQLMSKDDLALDIYKYGLRNVPIKNEQQKLLEGMHCKLASKLSLPRAVSLLFSMPLEIVQIILQYLDFRNVVMLLRVSKQWQHLLQSLPSLWRNLDLSKASKLVSSKAIKNYVKHCRGDLRRVIMARFNGNVNLMLGSLLAYSAHLQYLEVSDGHVDPWMILKSRSAITNLTSIIVSRRAQISLDGVCSLLEKCPNLERAEFHAILANRGPAVWRGDLSKLKVLWLECLRWGLLNDIYLQTEVLIPKIQGIRELSLRKWGSRPLETLGLDFSSATQLEKLDLHDADLSWFPRLPSSLRTLDISNPNFIATGWHAPSLTPQLPNLQHLFMASFFERCPDDNAYHAAVTLLAPSRGGLETLDMSSFAFDDEQLCILFEVGLLDNLSTLIASRVTKANDHVAELIAQRLQRLTVLDLSHTGVTGVGVKALVLKQGVKLQQLNLNHCREVSIDAVEFARSQGIHVDFFFPDNLKYGKRIRYG